MSDFVDRVRKGLISNPLQRAFTVKEWEDEFNSLNNPSTQSERLYKSGIWFSDKLEKVRSYVNELNTGTIDQSFLLRSICSGINRDILIARNEFLKSFDGKEETFLIDSILSKDIDDTLPGVNFDGFVESVVDGGQLAISTVQSEGCGKGRINFNEIHDYCYKIRNLGNYYSILVHYWKECQWNNWYVDVESEKNVDVLKQPKNQLSFSRAFSDHREDKLASEISSLSRQSWKQLSVDDRLNILNSVETVKSIDENGNIILAPRAKDIDTVPDTWGMRHLAEEVYWNDLLKSELPEFPGINIRDLLNLWEVLFSLGKYFDDKIDATTEVENIEDLTKFCFSIKKSSLIELVQKVLTINFDLATKITNNLVFNNNKRDEIWDRPFIDLMNGDLAIINSALCFPNMIRYVETWMRKGGLKLSKRGILFEEYSKSSLKKSFENFNYDSKALVLFDIPELLTFKEESEEIDLLFLIGDLIVVGEVKCQFYPTNPLEIHNTIEQIKKGTKQVKRKSKFLAKHLEEFVSRYKLDENKDYSFSNCVVTNRTLGTGMSINSVPIIDINILTKYFDSDHLPLFYDFETDTYRERFDFYSSLREAKHKFKDYLNIPAQLMVFIPYLKRVAIQIPSLS